MSEIINSFISCTIDILVVFIFGLIIFGKENNNKKIKNILVITICSILHTLVYLYFNGTTKTMLTCLIFAITLKSIFNISISKSILSAIVYIIILVIPDMMTLGIITKVLNISKEYCYTTFAGGILSNLIVSILMILIIYIIRKPLRKILNNNISSSKKIIFISIITILFTLFFFYKFATGYRMNENVIIYVISMIAFITILFILFKEKLENETVMKKYDELLDIMKTYETDIEEQRTLIHETRNELATIRCKICDKDKDSEIIKYIDSIMGDKVSSNMSKYSKFKYLPSNGLKGFFYYKSMEAERKGLKVSVNISKTLENSFLGNMDTKSFKDLGRIIGVYLDNAIQASEESKDKKLGIELYLIGNTIHFIVSNTYNNKIDLDKIGNEKYTTKGKNHGHGLLLVNRILHNNKRFSVNNKITKELYIQELMIKEK